MEFTNRTMFKNHLSIYSKMQPFSNLDVNSFEKQITCYMCLQILNYLLGPVVLRGDINSSYVSQMKVMPTTLSPHIVWVTWFTYDGNGIADGGSMTWLKLHAQQGGSLENETTEGFSWLDEVQAEHGKRYSDGSESRWCLKTRESEVSKINQRQIRRPSFSSLLPSFHPHK